MTRFVAATVVALGLWATWSTAAQHSLPGMRASVEEAVSVRAFAQGYCTVGENCQAAYLACYTDPMGLCSSNPPGGVGGEGMACGSCIGDKNVACDSSIALPCSESTKKCCRYPSTCISTDTGCECTGTIGTFSGGIRIICFGTPHP